MAALPRIVLAVPFFVLALTAGCAFDVADVRYAPALFEESRQPGERQFVLAADVPIPHPPCGFSRTLRHGTQWKFVGTLPQGEVFRSSDQALTLECSNVFEAYLVVSGVRLLGFYLPVERGFVKVSEPVHLPVER